MGSRNRDNKVSAVPDSHRLITYKDSFPFPITKNGSTQNLRITLRWLFFPVPNPTNSPQPKDFSVKAITFKKRDLLGS